MQPLTLYRYKLSGHSHRVELFLSILKLNYKLKDVDLSKGEHKTPEFLTRNPFGQVPVLQDGDLFLSDSNAILVYLASKYAPGSNWGSTDPVRAYRIQRYLSVAAGPIAGGPATTRLIKLFGADLDYKHASGIATKILAVIDADLASHPWLAGEDPSIADLANYTYIAHAPEGGIDLGSYPNIQRWLAGVEQLPGFVPMAKS